MRKSLIALACLSAMTCSALAAEVELYGTVDTYIAVNHQGGETNTSLRSGGASASFWGIKGTEDIGPDLKAIFKLESAFLADTGAFPEGANGALFSREAWVGLHSNTWGTLSFGRQYTPHFLTWAMTDPTDLSLGSSYSPFFFPMPTGVNGEVGDSLVRHSNSLLYVSPRMAGVQLFAYAALGEETDSAGNITGSEDGNVYNIAANYVNGPLFVMASVLYQDYSGNQGVNLGYTLDGTYSGDPKHPDRQTNGHGMYYNLGVTYDFGVTKLSGAFMYKDGEDTDTVPNFWVAQIGAATPMLGGRWSVSASMLSNETQDDADAYSLGTRFDYPLSKRTKVYVGYEVVFNDDNAKYSVEAGPDSSLHYANEWGQTQGQFFMGINHKF